MKKATLHSSLAALLFSGAAIAQVAYTNHSVTPTLLNLNSAAFPTVQAYSLLGSRDTLPASPGYRFGGSADGAGVVHNSNGTFTLVVNHEDNFSVSRVTLDSTFRPVNGQYLLNSNAGMWRLCSATLATPDVHGFGPAFLTCGESSTESMTHIVNIYGQALSDSITSANTTLCRGIGHWNAENAVPLPLAAYGQTIVMIGDDDSGPNGGQLAMYVANSVGDMNNGHLYVLRRTDLNQRERDIIPGQSYPVEFVEIPNASTLTGAQIDAYANTTAMSVKFQRVEDIDYRKGGPQAAREIYFNATGAATADSVDRTVWGRVYRLVLDPSNPLAGTLECIINGDDKSLSNPFNALYQPDNICVTEDYVYVQEDPNGYTFPAALPYVHDARIYQYDIATGAFVQLLEFNHHRTAADSAVYNRNSAGTAFQVSPTGGWEYGSLTDLSNVTGVPNSFLLCLQPHTWRYPEFTAVDGGTVRPNERQGSQLIVLTGLARVKVDAPVSMNDTICPGETATLVASGGTTFWQTNGTVYEWYTQPANGSPVHTGSSFTTAPLAATATYYVETIASGDTSAIRTAVTVVVNPTPATPQISQSGNTLTSSAAAGNQWYRNGILIAGATNQNLVVTLDGYYTVQVTENGCPSIASDEVFMNITAIEQPAMLNDIRIFPNPNQGVFTINFNTDERTESFRVEIVNSIGQVIFKENVTNFAGSYLGDVTIDGAEGIYFVNIYTDTHSYQQQLIKQ
jgi:hypothetical protein